MAAPHPRPLPSVRPLRGAAWLGARATLRAAGMNFAFLDPAPDACAQALGEHIRADYGDQDVPKYPSMFYRAPHSLAPHRGPVVLPHESVQHVKTAIVLETLKENGGLPV